MTELIDRMANNPHPKAKEMLLVMEAERDYYADHQTSAAIDKLKNAISTSNYKSNAVNSLIQIYKKQENFAAVEQLKHDFPNHQIIDED